ncbi:hypothetical protein [Anaerostipes hadrus]|uniref:hypothetical protein n=1 Tax=Anaerostipes hadrus TaxID=649756 RepID=UPI00156DE5D0|nr:hypothetical protein [Anaerostipes hadrus]
MQILDRLKMELSNQEYFSDEQYTQFLLENGLSAVAEYNKATDQRQMLLSALDILEAVSNDIDIMRQTITEFTTTSQAYKYLEKRIQNLRDKIASIPEPEEEYSCFSLMFTSKNPTVYSPADYGSRRISKSDIDVMMGGE